MGWRKGKLSDKDKVDIKAWSDLAKTPVVVIPQGRLDEAQKALDKENERRGYPDHKREDGT